MAPTEATILSTFLLPPAQLPTIISLQAFKESLPRSQQSSPHVKALYRDLQHQRARVVDAVTHNIASEVKRGNTQQRAVVRERRKAEIEEQDDEVDIEHALFGSTSNLEHTKSHSLTSILPELEHAASQVEEEIQRLEDEAEALLGEIQGIVGGLSDVRYGRLANSKLPAQVVDGLERLEASCRTT